MTLGSNPNYTVTPIDAALTVNPRVATVMAERQTKTYGDANPALTAVVTGPGRRRRGGLHAGDTATQHQRGQLRDRGDARHECELHHDGDRRAAGRQTKAATVIADAQVEDLR